MPAYGGNLVTVAGLTRPAPRTYSHTLDAWMPMPSVMPLLIREAVLPLLPILLLLPISHFLLMPHLPPMLLFLCLRTPMPPIPPSHTPPKLNFLPSLTRLQLCEKTYAHTLSPP